MSILFIVDARLRIHRSSLSESGERDLNGKALYDVIDEESCKLIEQWWGGNPFAPLRITVNPLPEFLDVFVASCEVVVSPLITSSGSVDFVSLEGLCKAEEIQAASVQIEAKKDVEEFESADLNSVAAGRELALLQDVTALVNASLDANETLEQLAKLIVKRKEFVHVAFYLLDGDSLIRSTYAGAKPSSGSFSIPLGEGPIGLAGYEGTPVVVSEKDTDQWNPISEISRSLLVVPIVNKAIVDNEETESVSGVIVLESEESNAFAQDEVRRMASIASSAAMAIENMRLLQQTILLLQSESAQRLEISRQKAELDEFVHTISHDLRNPLNNITGFAELLGLELDSDANPQISKYLSRIEANVGVISRMIQDLLELSRVGRVDDQKEPLDIDQLMKEIKFDFTMSNDDNNLELNIFNMPRELTGNRSRLHQLFSNLIGNAVKYSHPERPPRVTITCVDEGKHYRFCVSDNGIGLDEQHFNSIFVFGVRIRENEAEGTGAGLAIAKKIVESHEGRIWVESEKGEGSTFNITLPKTPSN